MVDPRDDNGGKLREDAMRLGRFRIAAVSLFAFALGAAATSVRAADPIPFKIGISAPVVTIFPVWMGEAGGFYEKEGLKVDVINMEGGTRGLQVLLSGEIQGMHVGLAPAVLANKQGADLRLVTIDLAAAKTPWIFDSVVVSSSYLKSNRATLTRFVKAYVAGAYLALADETKAKEVIAQKFKTNDAKVIAATY